MIGIHDLLLALICLIPLVGACFVAVIPQFDMASIRQITGGCLLIQCLYVAFLYYGDFSHTLVIDVSRLTLFGDSWKMLVGPSNLLFVMGVSGTCCLLVFLHLYDTVLGRALCSVMLVVVAAVSFGLLIDSLSLALFVSNATMWILLLLIAQMNNSLNGAPLMQTAIFFTAADIAGAAMLLGWSFVPPVPLWQNCALLVITLPALSRLCLLVFAPYFKHLIRNLSLELSVLFIGFMVPQGASLYLLISRRMSAHMTADYVWMIDIAAAISALFALMMAYQEEKPHVFFSTIGVPFWAFFCSAALHLQLLGKSYRPFYTTLLSSFVVIATFAVLFLLLCCQIVEKDEHDQESYRIFDSLALAGVSLLIGLPLVGAGYGLWQFFMLFSRTLPLEQWVIWPVILGIAVYVFSHMIRRLITWHRTDSARRQDSSGNLLKHKFWFVFAVLLVLTWILPQPALLQHINSAWDLSTWLS